MAPGDGVAVALSTDRLGVAGNERPNLALTTHYVPSVNCDTAFQEACGLFNAGRFYDATGQTRAMFDVDTGGLDVSVDIVWCDHLPSLRFIYPGMVEFRRSGGTLTCMLQCEQLRARTISAHGLCHAVNLMLHVHKAGLLGAKPVLFDTGDGLSVEVPDKIAYCSSIAADHLVMDPEFAFSNGYAAVREAATTLPPWQERTDKVAWRGATTGQVRPNTDAGGGGAPDCWDWLQRLKLCAVAERSRHADFLDIGISNIVQLDEAAAALVRDSGFMRPRLLRDDFGLFRYAVDIDGNTNAWSSLFTKLLMGCCVLKIDSPFGFRQWYYERMRPWEHYAPVAADFSDFDWVVERLRRNSDLAANIAACGHDLAKSVTVESALDRAISSIFIAVK